MNPTVLAFAVCTIAAIAAAVIFVLSIIKAERKHAASVKRFDAAAISYKESFGIAETADLIRDGCRYYIGMDALSDIMEKAVAAKTN